MGLALFLPPVVGGLLGPLGVHSLCPEAEAAKQGWGPQLWSQLPIYGGGGGLVVESHCLLAIHLTPGTAAGGKWLPQNRLLGTTGCKLSHGHFRRKLAPFLGRHISQGLSGSFQSFCTCWVPYLECVSYTLHSSNPKASFSVTSSKKPSLTT